MVDIVFRSAKVPDRAPEMPVDVLVSNGIFAAIGNIPALQGRLEIDCAGMWMLPGAIDMHVHFREPGATHKEDILSGTRAAVLGGVTTVADMPNNTPPIVTSRAFLEKAAMADANAMCDMKLYMGLTAENLDEIIAVADHRRFAGVKVFLGATTGSMLCDIDTVARAARRLDCLFVFHAESEALLRAAAAALGPGLSASDHLALRPVEAAVDAVRRVASIFRPGMRFHICHVSTTAELDIINRSGGITCETAPHYLAFSASMTDVAGNFAKMNPPLRDEADREALFKALIAGRIDCIATDHAPHLRDEKLRPWPGAPSGVPGVETLVPWTLRQVQLGHMSIQDAVRLLSTGPASILGLADRGRIQQGMRADLMLWDPESTWEVNNSDIASMCGWSLFDGMVLAGKPVHTCVAGKLLY